MPAQPASAPGTRKQAVTEKLLHNGRAVAYREQWCLRAPHGPPRGLRQKVAGRAIPIRHAHGVVARHPAATRTTTKTTLTGKDATSPLKLTLNGA